MGALFIKEIKQTSIICIKTRVKFFFKETSTF